MIDSNLPRKGMFTNNPKTPVTATVSQTNIKLENVANDQFLLSINIISLVIVNPIFYRNLIRSRLRIHHEQRKRTRQSNTQKLQSGTDKKHRIKTLLILQNTKLDT